MITSPQSAVPAGIVTATSDFTVNQYTGLKLSAGEPKVFTGRINQGDVLISLKVEIPDAPEGTKVNVAVAGGDNTPIFSDGTIVSETGGIVAMLDNVNNNYEIKGSEYIPPGVNKSVDSSAIIVKEATELTFSAVHSYSVGKDLAPGTYTYNFVAQAFIE